MNKIIKTVLISGLLPIISGCNATFFKATPEVDFELTLNGGTAIKCSHGQAESQADSLGKLIEKLATLRTLPRGFLDANGKPMLPDDKQIKHNEDMLKVAFSICKHVTGSTKQTESAETQKN